VGKVGKRPNAPMVEVRFAYDSPLEGDGFELPVPREKKSKISVSRWSSTDLVYGTVARISPEPSGRHTREQYRADKFPVDGEGPSREALEDAQKAPDRDKGREAADNQADGEHQPAVRIEAGVPIWRPRVFL
jgi:hypothetical protein